MVVLEIALIVIGILIFAGSFFVTEKLSSSDMKEITKVSEKEIKNVIDKQLDRANPVIKERIDDKLEEAVNDFAIRSDDEFVNKMNQIGEYSEKVLETMNKTNKEIVFIHSMLNDKQEAVSEMTNDFNLAKSQLLQLKSDVDDSIKELKEQYQQNIKLQKEQSFISGIEATSIEKPVIKSFEEELIEKINTTSSNGKEEVPESFVEAVEIHKLLNNQDNEHSTSDVDELTKELNENIENKLDSSGFDTNSKNEQIDTIVKLYNEGYTEIDIAQKLGKGIGEVKLVLGLYNKDI